MKNISKVISANLQIKNAACVYQFGNLFCLTSVQKLNLNYIERCFTLASDTDSFMLLDYTSISKILASSSLLITSEVEVFNALKKWLNYNIEERSKYAEDLLLKVRLHRLPNKIIRHLLNDSTVLGNYCGFGKNVKRNLEDKNKFLNQLSSSRRSRYCKQQMFEILVCGGVNSKTRNTCNGVRSFDLRNKEVVNAYPPMIKERYLPSIVYLKGDLYIFGGRDGDSNWIESVEKFSHATKRWSNVGNLKKLSLYSACAFMDKVIVIGGFINGSATNYCLQFDTSNYSWKEIARMNKARSGAACAVFEERVVVAGGWGSHYSILNSVESYNVHSNRWSQMPNMNTAKSSHSLVVVNNKLFVISRESNTCEVFDNVCKKFIILKSPEISCFFLSNACSVGNKIYVFQDSKAEVIVFDTDENKWLEEPCEITRDLRSFYCVKVPYLRHLY